MKRILHSKAIRWPVSLVPRRGLSTALLLAISLYSSGGWAKPQVVQRAEVETPSTQLADLLVYTDAQAVEDFFFEANRERLIETGHYRPICDPADPQCRIIIDTMSRKYAVLMAADFVGSARAVAAKQIEASMSPAAQEATLNFLRSEAGREFGKAHAAITALAPRDPEEDRSLILTAVVMGHGAALIREFRTAIKDLPLERIPSPPSPIVKPVLRPEARGPNP